MQFQLLQENIASIIGIIISGIILYHLYRPHIKAYFGKAANLAFTSAAKALCICHTFLRKS
jgi:cbb3-type cytochrome oxidase subunit 3